MAGCGAGQTSVASVRRPRHARRSRLARAALRGVTCPTGASGGKWKRLGNVTTNRFGMFERTFRALGRRAVSARASARRTRRFRSRRKSCPTASSIRSACRRLSRRRRLPPICGGSTASPYARDPRWGGDRRAEDGSLVPAHPSQGSMRSAAPNWLNTGLHAQRYALERSPPRARMCHSRARRAFVVR